MLALHGLHLQRQDRIRSHGPLITHNSAHHSVCVSDRLRASRVTGRVITNPFDPTDRIIFLQRTATVCIIGTGGELPDETPRPVNKEERGL